MNNIFRFLSRGKMVVMAIIFLSIIQVAPSVAADWTSLGRPTKPRTVKDIAINADGSTIYVADQTAVYKSTNGGTNWTKPSSDVDFPLVITCKPDDPSNVVAGIAGSLKWSSNGGSSWPSTWTITGTIQRLTTSPINSSNIYMGKRYSSGTYSLYFSRTGGSSWNGNSNFTNTTDINDIAPYPTGNKRGNVWMVGSNPNGASDGSNVDSAAGARGVWFSYDSGSTWSGKKMGSYNLTSVGIRDRGTGVDEYVFVGGAAGKLFHSSNAGSNWSERTAYASASSATIVRSIRIRTDSTIMYVASDKGIHRSTDDGANWTNISGSMIYLNVLALAVEPNDQKTMFATTDRAIYKTTNAGGSWAEIGSTLGGPILLQAAAGTGPYAWAISKEYSLVAKYDSVGNSWSTMNVGGGGSVFSGERLTIHPNGDIFAVGSENNQAKLYRSTDNVHHYCKSKSECYCICNVNFYLQRQCAKSKYHFNV